MTKRTRRDFLKGWAAFLAAAPLVKELKFDSGVDEEEIPAEPELPSADTPHYIDDGVALRDPLPPHLDSPYFLCTCKDCIRKHNDAIEAAAGLSIPWYCVNCGAASFASDTHCRYCHWARGAEVWR